MSKRERSVEVYPPDSKLTQLKKLAEPLLVGVSKSCNFYHRININWTVFWSLGEGIDICDVNFSVKDCTASYRIAFAEEVIINALDLYLTRDNTLLDLLVEEHQDFNAKVLELEIYGKTLELDYPGFDYTAYLRAVD